MDLNETLAYKLLFSPPCKVWSALCVFLLTVLLFPGSYAFCMSCSLHHLPHFPLLRFLPTSLASIHHSFPAPFWLRSLNPLAECNMPVKVNANNTEVCLGVLHHCCCGGLWLQTPVALPRAASSDACGRYWMCFKEAVEVCGGL